MTADSTARRRFTLAEAQQMLPRVRALTERAAQEVDQLSSAIDRLGETDSARAPTLAELDGVVAGWVGQLQGLGLESRGCGWWTSTTVRVTIAGSTMR